ncbi:MAG: sel1 repeat family protein [Gammaproteobacteria bacterium]|nr:sel1 repeat family protein [Gammaproteobacteria bacterium]
MRKQLLLSLFILCYLSTAHATDLLEVGVRAFERGDYQTSLQNWLPLAEAGHVEAQLFMGVLYRYGLAVEKNPQQSAYWYGRAAENGDVDAQNELGLFYELGWGVKQDIWQAASWYEQVREQDICLSDTLATGRLVVMDE